MQRTRYKHYIRRPKTTVERREEAAAKADGEKPLRRRHRPDSHDDLSISAIGEKRDRAKAKSREKKQRRAAI